MRRSALIALAAFFVLPTMAGAQNLCRIGKPSYCFKYGQAICERENTAPDKAAACQSWTAACLDCHNAIPTCLGNKRPASDAPQCTSCSTAWQGCMAKIDARYWPNRPNR